MLIAAATPLSTETFPPTDTPDRALFSVSAEIDPGTLPRVLELFAKRGLTPDSIHADRHEEVLAIDIAITGMDADLAAYIGRCLREIHVVREVKVETCLPGTA